jgi:hypothetical protein
MKDELRITTVVMTRETGPLAGKIEGKTEITIAE